MVFFFFIVILHQFLPTSTTTITTAVSNEKFVTCRFMLLKMLPSLRFSYKILSFRSDRTDVVGELRTAEEQVEELRSLCEAYTRSLEKCLHTHTTSDEKKLVSMLRFH